LTAESRHHTNRRQQGLSAVFCQSPAADRQACAIALDNVPVCVWQGFAVCPTVAGNAGDIRIMEKDRVSAAFRPQETRSVFHRITGYRKPAETPHRIPGARARTPAVYGF